MPVQNSKLRATNLRPLQILLQITLLEATLQEVTQRIIAIRPSPHLRDAGQMNPQVFEHFLIVVLKLHFAMENLTTPTMLQD